MRLIGYHCVMVSAIRQAFRHSVLCLILAAPGIVVAAESGVVLLYHHVATGTPPSTSISPEDFRAHLDYLRDTTSLFCRSTNWSRACAAGRPCQIALSPSLLTMGIRQSIRLLFRFYEYDMPFALFVSTEPINNRQKNYMTWEQIRALSEAGALIANHMVSHPMLSRNNEETDANWLARQRAELLEAEDTILKETGKAIAFLPIPTENSMRR